MTNKEFLHITRTNVDEVGYHLTLVNGGQHPDFSYSIGLTEKLGFKLIIADGELIYTLHSALKDEIIIMTYEIKGNLLIIDQPSSPKKEETEFRMTYGNRLELFFSGERSVYTRNPKS